MSLWCGAGKGQEKEKSHFPHRIAAGVGQLDDTVQAWKRSRCRRASNKRLPLFCGPREAGEIAKERVGEEEH